MESQMLQKNNGNLNMAILLFSRNTKKSTYKILLIDDDEDFSDAMSIQLKHDIGCSVDKATNPYEAMNALVESYYDLVLLDWKLQTMSGWSALQRTDEMLSIDTEISPRWDETKVPVIIITANAANEVKALSSVHFQRIGFLTKTSTVRELSENIQQLILKQKQRAS
ncbi:MAG: response regulator [Pseudobdellovibrionaceae bacterium]